MVCRRCRPVWPLYYDSQAQSAPNVGGAREARWTERPGRKDYGRSNEESTRGQPHRQSPMLRSATQHDERFLAGPLVREATQCPVVPQHPPSGHASLPKKGSFFFCFDIQRPVIVMRMPLSR